MSSFMNRALAYLGLKDIDEEDLYSEDASVGAPGSAPDRTVFPDPGPDEAEGRGVAALVRPIGAADPRRPAATGSGAVRPLGAGSFAASRVHVVAPAHFRDAQEIGDLVKQGSPVIVNLQMSERDLSRQNDRLLLRAHLRARRSDGEGRRPGVPARALERRGLA